MASPTQQTIERLKLWGFSVCIVERFIKNKHGGFRKDAFGFGDLLAFKDSGENKGVWLIQTTVRGKHQNRKEKAQGIPELNGWLRSGGRFAVVTWGVKGGKVLCNWDEVKL